MEVDLNAAVVRVQPTLTTSAYQAGECIGGLQTVSGLVDETNGTGTLLSLTVIDKKNLSVPIDICFYSQNPSGSTMTDNAAISMLAADHASYFLGRISVAAGDYATQALGTNLKDATKLPGSCGLKLKSTGGNGKIYVVLVATTTASGSWAAGAGDLTIVLGVDQD